MVPLTCGGAGGSLGTSGSAAESIGSDARPLTGVAMRRPISILSAGLVAFAIMTAASLGTAAPASAATIAPTTTCNNALGNGCTLCEITVVHTITPPGGSAVVTVRECTGSAGVPTTSCTNTTSPVSQPVTAVTQ